MFINNDTTKDDYEKFRKECKAATNLRDAIADVSLSLKYENPEASELIKKIKKALDKHEQERQKYWF